MNVRYEDAEKGSLRAGEHRLRPEPQWLPRYPSSGRLRDKVAIVTGGEGGIARAVAVLFAREGADVVLICPAETLYAHRTLDLVENEGGRCRLLKADPANPNACAEIVSATLDRFGQVDVLVNNSAEHQLSAEGLNLSEDVLIRTFQPSILGMIHLVGAARPHLRPGSAIVNCAFVTGDGGRDCLGDYSITNGAIIAFTRSLSKNLMKDGIRVNAIAPGRVWTPLDMDSRDLQAGVTRGGGESPMGRPGQPNEVAPAFLFLACQDSTYITGQVLRPNGGLVIDA